jgi:hypothetical protein
MKEKNTEREWESSPTWDELEAFARQGVRRPRVRGLEERFESRLVPLFKRRTEAVGRLLPDLYLHGLAAR